MNDAEYIAAIAGNYKNRQGPELQAHYERLMRISAALAAAPAQSGVRQFTDDERQFTKKPVTIQAIQWTGRNLREVIAFTDGPPDTRSAHAGMAWDAYVDLVARDGLKIYTLEGKMSAAVGDWIIKGVQGEHYPCKPDIFEATYSRAALAAPAQQPWQYTPPAQERIDALELEVRQLTEQIAELRHAPTPQAASQPAPVMAYPPLPARHRAFLCAKCGSRECEPGTIEEVNPPCKCGYLGFAEDLDFTASQMRAYVDADRAARAPADSVLEDAAQLERERICAAIKAEDDYCVEHGDYMLDSDDCIKIVRGEWVRPDYLVDTARKQGANHD